MPEAHTSYHGKLVRLSDEPIEDFVNDVQIARTLYDPTELDPEGLGSHTDELKNIVVELEERVTDNGVQTLYNFGLWGMLIDLSLASGNSGQAFLDTYAYTRTNRFLTAEFGRAETKSTLVLRKITDEVVRDKLSTKSYDTIRNFFDMTFPADMIEAIYPEFGGDNMHPELAEYLKKVERLKPPYFDPPLCRIISMLVARECTVVGDIPDEVRAGLLNGSKNVLSVSRRSGGSNSYKLLEPHESAPSPKVNDVSSSDAREDNEDDVEGDEADLATVLTAEKKFKSSDGACYVEKKAGMTDELYDALVATMARAMFPTDGVGVIEAQAICAECDVTAACLKFALDNRIESGVWGGASERERRRILAELRLAREEQQAADSA